jgi:hypothetical protein
MSAMTRIIALVILLTAATGIARTDLVRDAGAQSTVVSEELDKRPTAVSLTPTITYLDGPTAERQELIDWALNRYKEAGLLLPDLEVAFPATCGGKAGRYLVGQARIEFCNPTRIIVLHELAHAWDDAAMVDRNAFLEHRDLEHWYEQDCDESESSGGEELALVLAWGLMDVDVTARAADFAAQPVAEQPRYLPGMDNSASEQLQEMFRMIAGVAPLSSPR